ncbi:MAG: type II toxin-antitoxin system YafO family toxin [Endozoicomonas sp.]|uniref:type II toxin-antitoxin system YafO family toxin n=1 Tax=Endozoicomonas sp. TaxID=1892382 RepID=UPI003D9B93FE
MVRVLLSAVLQEAANRDVRISQIAKAFKVYKETGKAGTLIGRDVDIGYPISAKQNQLMHAHLYPGRLRVRGVPVRQHDRTSDIFLIYCEGLMDSNAFCLID